MENHWKRNLLKIHKCHPYKIKLIVQKLIDDDFDRRLEYCDVAICSRL